MIETGSIHGGRSLQVNDVSDRCALQKRVQKATTRPVRKRSDLPPLNETTFGERIR